MNLLDIVKKGSTDRSVVIRIIDSSDGTPETGVEHNTSGIDLWYRREGAAKSSITEAALAALTTAHTDGGIEHIGDGAYRLDLPDAAYATGANYVDVGGTVTGMIVIGGRVRLVDFDLESATVDVGKWKGSTPADLADTDKLPVSVQHWSLSGITTDITGNLSGSVGSVTGAVGSVTGAVGSVTGNVGGNVVGSVGSISGVTFPTNFAALGIESDGDLTKVNTLDGHTAQTANHATNIAAVKAVTDVIPDSGAMTSIATAAELAKVPKSDSNVTWNATALASINAEADTALSDYDPPTRTEATADKDEILADIATAQSDLDIITGSDGATLATTQGNYAPAKAGDNMGLIDDAITEDKFDETTAFPQRAETDGYEGGFVWFEPDSENTGTTVGTNGTRTNPTGTLNDAVTIANSVNGTTNRRIKFIPGSQEGYTQGTTLALPTKTAIDLNGMYLDVGSNLTLGGVSCNIYSSTPGASIVHHAARWSITSNSYIDHLLFNGTAGLTLAHGVSISHCTFKSTEGSIKVSPAVASVPVHLYACYFQKDGQVFDFTDAADGCTLILDDCWGHVSIQNLTGTQKVIYRGWGKATLESSCDGGEIIYDSHVAINDEASEAVTETLESSATTAAEIKTAMEVDGGKLDHLWEMTEDDSGTRRLTSNALEEAPSSGGGAGDATEAKQDEILEDIADIKGTGFVKDTNSLVNLSSGSAVNVHTENVNIISEDS